MPIYYSDFNDPSELNNYYYDNDSYRGAQITNGYLEVYIGLYGKTAVYVMSAVARYNQAIPGSGVKIKARVSAYSNNNNMSAYAGVIDGIIVISTSDSKKNVRFGFSTPYQLAIDVETSSSANRPYQSGSWNGSDTGWHTLEMDLYSDHIDFYFDGQLVYTLNNNPLANDQIYFGIIASAGTGGGSSGYARADWLEVDPISSLVDTTAYSSLSTQQTYVYTPNDATAYPSLTTTQTYTPPPPVYTPVDAMAYPSMATQQTYIYTPVDTTAYPSMVLQQPYVSPPTPTPITPLPSVSQYYLLVFILLFLMLLALSRKRS